MKIDKQKLQKIVLPLILGLVFGLLLSSLLNQPNLVNNVKTFFSQAFESNNATSTTAEIEEVEEYKPAIAYENAVTEAVEEANPTVVSIVITKDLPVMQNYYGDFFGNMPPEFRDFFGYPEQEPQDQKKTEKKEIGGGTGFIVSPDGLIVTNKHVIVDKEAEYTVLTNKGEKYSAEIVAEDPAQDIAILKIDAENLKSAKLGNSDSVKLGQTAIAIGNALGEFRNTVSVGVVSGLSRSITASGADFVERLDNVIQTDAAINQGNSGGPLLNLKGEVIGMNTAIAQGAQNIGFAIPVNRIKRDIESVKTSGEIKVPFLGVRYRLITPDFAESQDLPVKKGALIRGSQEGPAVVPDSAADKADLQAEDIITKINGKEVTLDQTLGYLIQRFEIGDTITVTVLRDGEEIDLTAQLEERPEI